MEVAGQYALVTGGARRIGRSICIALAHAGADVVVHYRSSERDAEETAQLCRELGARSVAFGGDLSSAQETIAVWRAACDELNAPPTILINNASVYRRETFSEVTAESFDNAVAVNLRAPMILVQQMARDLPPLGVEGCVVNLNDSRQEYRTRWAYGVTASALSSLTRALSASTPDGIRVNELRLGPVLTPEDREASKRSDHAKHAKLIPLDAVAQAVLNLIRDDSASGCSSSLNP